MKHWIEKKVQWKYPESDCASYPQPPEGQPYTIFAACILPGWRPDDLKVESIPKGYCIYLTMCSHSTRMKPESLLKRRKTVLKNIVAKKSAGMPEFISKEIERIERQKKDPDYFDLETCISTQKFRKEVSRELEEEKIKKLAKEIQKLDNYQNLKVKTTGV